VQKGIEFKIDKVSLLGKGILGKDTWHCMWFYFALIWIL
jgi:hypothetical protein